MKTYIVGFYTDDEGPFRAVAVDAPDPEAAKLEAIKTFPDDNVSSIIFVKEKS